MDIKFGRYKTVDRCMHILLIMLLITMILQLLSLFLPISYSYDDNWTIIGQIIHIIILWISILASVIVVNANIIQFGMDQLHNSPVDHQSLFIHWYFWTWNADLLASQVFVYHFHIQLNNLSEKQQLISVIILPLVIVLHIITLSIVHCKTRWFVIDSAQGNQYTLVYRVTKFSYKHKVPIQRSAFTYCEDEVPSGLDLGSPLQKNIQ